MKIKYLNYALIVISILLLTDGAVAAVLGPVIYVQPPDQAAITGGNFTINITVDAKGYDIYGAEYSLRFDPTRLEALSQTKGKFLTKDGSNSFALISIINNSAGFIDYGESRTQTTTGVNGTGVLSMIVFHVKGEALAGNTTLDLMDVLLTDPIPIEIPDVSVLDGTVDIIANKPPVANCGEDKLKCENVNSPVQFNASASYDPDGAVVSYFWEFGDGTNGTGSVLKHTYLSYKWNGNKYLPFVVNLTVEDDKSLTGSTLQNVVIWIAGDANGDGKVDIIDASIIGRKWGLKDPCADLNNDGIVNILDASILGGNWGKTPVIQ
jgi:hypothetical protein